MNNIQEEVIGQVESTYGERAIVEVFKKGTKKKSGEKLDASNQLNAKPGFVVNVAWRQISKKKDNMMLILPPVLATIAGLIVSYHMVWYIKKPLPREQVMLVGTLIWTLLGAFYSFRYWRYTYGRGLQPTITGIIRKY